MRERHAAQLAAAFILKAGRALGVVRLMKLMYLAEREAMRRCGLPIVFDDIYAMREGMVLSRTFDLMTAKQGTPSTGEWAEYIAPPSHRGLRVCQGVGPTSLDVLSRPDMEVVDCVWESHGASSRDALVHEVHHHLDEWTEHWFDPKRGRSAVAVPYDKLVPMVHSPAGQEADVNARLDIAATLFRERALSLGRAARFAGLPIAAFMAEVSKRRIPAIAGDAESLRQDLKAIEACRGGS